MLPTERSASPVPASAELSPIFQQTLDVVPNHVNLEAICPSAKDRSRKLCSWAFPHLPDCSACARAGLAPRQWSLWGRQGAGGSGNCLCGFEAYLRAKIMCGGHVYRSRYVLPTSTTKGSPSAPLLRVLAMRVLVPFHSGHCNSTHWPLGGLGSLLLLPEPSCREELLIGLLPMFSDVAMPSQLRGLLVSPFKPLMSILPLLCDCCYR